MAKGSFGELLKRERELREISLHELTKATRVAPRFLEALENEQWDKLPGGVFNRGVVRAIARYLGLSEDRFLSEYDLARGWNGMSGPAETPNSIASPSKWRFGLVLIVILVGIAGLLAGGVYAWRRYAAHRAARRTPTSSMQSSSPAVRAGLLPGATVTSSSRSLDLGGDHTRLARGVVSLGTPSSSMTRFR
jgi:cytoskeletal protein RodZ